MKKTFLAVVLAVGLAGCGGPDRPTLPVPPEELLQFPLNDVDDIAATPAVSLDAQVTSDGLGSVRVEATEPMVVTLAEVRELDIQNAVLIFQAQLRSENLEGHAYLEMELQFPEGQEASTQGRQQQVGGTTAWTTATAPYFFQPGQPPELVRLNLVVEGSGTVWVDDARLLRTPLPSPR